MWYSERFVGSRQADATEGVGEVLGEMLPVGSLNPGPTLAGATEFPQQVHADRVQSAQINDHLTQSKSGVGGQEIPAPNAAGSQGSFDVGGLE